VSDRPTAVHIDDLAEPVLPPAIVAAQKEMEKIAAGLDFSVDGLCAAAAGETGLDDFGDEGFRERLALLIRSLEDDHEFSAMGWVGRFAILTRFLKNRLLVKTCGSATPRSTTSK